MVEAGLSTLLRADLARYQETYRLRGQKAPVFRIILESLVFKAGFQAVILYRLAYALHSMGLNYLAWAVSRFNQFLTSAEIEFNVQAGPGLFIAHPGGLVVGRGTVLGARSTLFQGVSFGAADWHPGRIASFPRTGDNVFIFAGAKVLGGIRLGNNVVVGANAVLTQDLPSGAMAVGSPARILPGRGASLIKSWGLSLSPEE
jgi:serine O-acetyltransferase